MHKHSLLLIAACSSKPDDKPPPAPPHVDAKPALPSCEGYPPQPLRCRELPFEVELDNVTRTATGTVSTFFQSLGDGSIHLLQVAPRIAPPTAHEITNQIGIAARHEHPDAVPAPPRHGHAAFTTPGGVVIEAVGELIGGYVAIRVVAGKPGDPSGPDSASAQAFLGPLKRVTPDQGYVETDDLRLPARAWRYESQPAKATIYALPDLQATLGIRRLEAGCDGLLTDEPRAFVDLRAPTDLTVDTVERVPIGIRVTTRDERPAVYALICRRRQLLEVGLRGLAITPAMRATLDQVIQEPGSATRDASSSSDRAQ